MHFPFPASRLYDCGSAVPVTRVPPWACRGAVAGNVDMSSVSLTYPFSLNALKDRNTLRMVRPMTLGPRGRVLKCWFPRASGGGLYSLEVCAVGKPGSRLSGCSRRSPLPDLPYRAEAEPAPWRRFASRRLAWREDLLSSGSSQSAVPGLPKISWPQGFKEEV